jgi:hypothetical protein
VNVGASAEPVNLISKSSTSEANYVINILSTDLAKDENIKISISDKSVQEEFVDTSLLQSENLSFTFRNIE